MTEDFFSTVRDAAWFVEPLALTEEDWRGRVREAAGCPDFAAGMVQAAATAARGWAWWQRKENQ